MKLTQSIIEEIALYAELRGVKILELGVPANMLAEYNKVTFKDRILLSTVSIDKPIVSIDKSVRNFNAIQLTSIPEE